MKMQKEKKALAGEENIEEVLEFLKSARMLRKQIKLIKGLDLTEKEESVIKTVLKEVKEELILFKV